MSYMRSAPSTKLEWTHLVAFDISQQPLVALWVQVIRKHPTPFLRRRKSEGTNSSKYVRNDIIRAEQLNEPIVFGV